MKAVRLSREELHRLGYKPGDGRGGVISVMPEGKSGPAIRVPRNRTPNATEQRWLDEKGFPRWPDCYFRYEALSFRLASGAGYCPDWTAWRAGELVACVEVKGAWDHGSHSRSALAWKCAAQEWPDITWLWAQWKDGEWAETKIEPRRREA